MMFYLTSVLPPMVFPRLRLLLLGSASSPTQRNHVHSIEFKIILKNVEYPKKGQHDPPLPPPLDLWRLQRLPHLEVLSLFWVFQGPPVHS